MTTGYLFGPARVDVETDTADAGLWLQPEPGGGNGMFVMAWQRRVPIVALAKESHPPL